jgi:hypothetical protein
MRKLWLLLMLFSVCVMCLPAGAVGSAADAPRVGMPEWAAAYQQASPDDADGQQESTVGQPLGGGVGLAEQIRARLTNRESLGAGVGLSDALRERLMEQGALGTNSGASEEIQQRLMNRETLGAAVGMPERIRERLLGLTGSE